MRDFNPWVLISAVTLLVLCSVALISRIQTYNGDKDWDLIIFVQNWPNTVCMEWKERDPTHTCSFPKKLNQWTVHGAWPTKLGTKGPNFCDKTVTFNATLLNPIKKDLDQYWTDIELGGGHSKDELWKHEWTKHGSCAAMLPSLGNELKYFTQALKWSKSYNMGQVLSVKGLRPGKQYLPGDFSKAVYAAIGKNPFIECVHDSKTGLPYLEEIRICFDKTLKLVDCDGIKDRDKHALLTNCAPDKMIVFPNKVPSMNRTAPEEGPYQRTITGLSFLEEISLCFDKKLKLIDCVGVINQDSDKQTLFTNCDPNKMIIFPNKVPYRNHTVFEDGVTNIP